MTSFCLAAYEFYRRIVTKISGDKVTVKDDKEKLGIIIIGDATDLKAGDKFSVENGKIIKVQAEQSSVLISIHSRSRR